MRSLDIPDKLYFRIGEVCEIVGVKPHVLRFWETEFPHIKPSKTSGGSRLYSRKDIETISRIKYLLYDRGFTIPGARAELGKKTENDSAANKALVENVLAELRKIKSTLSD